MTPVVLIEDPDDRRLDLYRNLTDAELRQREEPLAGVFMVEGPAVIRQLLRSQYPVRSMLLTASRLDELGSDLTAVTAAPAESDWPVYVASNEVMRAVTGFHFHRGALAVAGRRPRADWRDLVAGHRVVAVAEDVGDHENMGALFRNAAGLGVGAVLLSPGSVDPLYRRAVRVSMGQVLRVPWARAAPWPDALVELRQLGFRILALTPDPAAPPLAEVLTGVPATDTDPAPPRGSVGPSPAGPLGPSSAEAVGPSAARVWDRVAVLLGAEGSGLTAAARARADQEARIPMTPHVDSLNVATAAAIAFYELFRHTPR